MSIPVSGDEMAPHAFLAIPLAAVVSVVHALSFFMVSLSLSLSLGSRILCLLIATCIFLVADP